MNVFKNNIDRKYVIRINRNVSQIGPAVRKTIHCPHAITVFTLLNLLNIRDNNETLTNLSVIIFLQSSRDSLEYCITLLVERSAGNTNSVSRFYIFLCCSSFCGFLKWKRKLKKKSSFKTGWSSDLLSQVVWFVNWSDVCSRCSVMLAVI